MYEARIEVYLKRGVSFRDVVFFGSEVRDQRPADSETVHFRDQPGPLRGERPVDTGLPQTDVCIDHAPARYFAEGRVQGRW